MRYQVYVADCAGVRIEKNFQSFGDALAFYRWIETEAHRRRDCIGMFNLDRCDYNTDGLTEDERYEVEGV